MFIKEFRHTPTKKHGDSLFILSTTDNLKKHFTSRTPPMPILYTLGRHIFTQSLPNIDTKTIKLKSRSFFKVRQLLLKAHTNSTSISAIIHDINDYYDDHPPAFGDNNNDRKIFYQSETSYIV